MMTVEELREWANRRVQDYLEEESHIPTMPTIITYRIPGSKGNTYILTVDKKYNNKTCSCPGFVYRRKCKHLSILETPDGLKGVI